MRMSLVTSYRLSTNRIMGFLNDWFCTSVMFSKA